VGTLDPAEQQITARQAAISHLNRRIEELGEKRRGLAGEGQSDYPSSTDQEMAAWKAEHPYPKATTGLSKRIQKRIVLAITLFALALYSISSFGLSFISGIRELDTNSLDEICLFIICIVFAPYLFLMLVAIGVVIFFYYRLFGFQGGGRKNGSKIGTKRTVCTDPW
jgi:hypothetical protein